MKGERALMTVFDAEAFDVAVIGAGHAGIEAALASARLGAKTACFSINLDAVGNMPCNPAIGGTAKGHLVREIDALGGEMARAADAACIQYRMLNRGKGPAVHSLRAQADRIKYRAYMKHALERQENLFLMQDEIVSIEVENGAVSAVVTAIGARHPVKAAVIASGTFLGGRVIIGEYTRESGPDGMAAAKPLTESLRGLGLRLQRFKTGTPPRINRRSINYTDLAEQAGEDEIIPFSFETDHPPDNRAVCYLTYTTAKTHEIIRANLSRSPLYGGQIEGVGPRYCPSIEDKVVRFADKPRHQLFLEPMGLDTEEVYVQGFSSSMPFDVQRVELLRELGKRCPVYLLSNTNLPHRIRFRESFRERFGGSFDELFVRCFYSDELHLRKPDPEIYRSVARQIGTPPGKLLFIDDNAANVSAARGEGWQACHLTGGITVTDLFEL